MKIHDQLTVKVAFGNKEKYHKAAAFLSKQNNVEVTVSTTMRNALEKMYKKARESGLQE